MELTLEECKTGSGMQIKGTKREMLDLISFNGAQAYQNCNIVIDTVDMMLLRCGV